MTKLYSIPPSHNHDEVYAKIGESGGVTDHGELTGLEDNDHPQYLLTTAKAADSDKLDGLDSTAFLQAGSWQSWTPTISYVGGSGTPTITANGHYMTIGKIVFLLLKGRLTRNGATHAYLTITTPTSIATFGSGSFTHQFGAANLSLGAVYDRDGSGFTVHTGAWTKDGLYWFSGFYEMP